MTRSEKAAPAVGGGGHRRRPLLPLWFWSVFVLATLGLVAAPLVAVLASPATATWAVRAPSVAVFLLVQPLARRLRGAWLWFGARDTPTRHAATTLVLVAAFGSVLVTILVRSDAIAEAFGVVVVAATAGFLAIARTRRDG